MKDVIEKLIADAPEGNEGAIDIQVQLGAQMYAGALKKSDEHVGFFEMIMVGQDSRSGQMTTAKIIMDPAAIQAVFVPIGSESAIYKPTSGLSIPGMS
jgi:hypothetical protein